MRKLAVIAFIPLLLAACATKSPPAAAVVPQPYVRVSNTDSNIVALQIAVRKFLPDHAAGPAVWLVATAHLGEPAYYRALQTNLDTQTLVLFEGVGPHPQPGVAPPPSAEETNATRSDLGSLQQTAAQSLGLVFQLDGINYDRPNFRNSDLSLEDLQRLLATPSAGGAGAPEEFNGLLQVMQGGTFFSTLINTTLKFIGTDEKLRGTARLVLIEMLGRLRGDLSRLSGVPPDLQRLLQTLIDSRNRKVIDDLKLALRHMPAQESIAILYGTGHMDNLEKHLRAELHYRPVDEQWFTAFSVNLSQSGITPAEAQTIRWFAQKQMEQLQPQ